MPPPVPRTCWSTSRHCGRTPTTSCGALVGSHTEVADLVEEYAALGIDEFILSGYPHIEEAYWFAEGVKPILRSRGLLRKRHRLSPVVQ